MTAPVVDSPQLHQTWGGLHTLSHLQKSPPADLSYDVFASEEVKSQIPFSHLSSPASHQVRLSVSARCRGDLSVRLESPGGTVSMLLDSRPNDASTAGLNNWTLMTVHCWGEQPGGLWTLQVCFLCFL